MSKIKLSVNNKEVLRTDGRPELIKGGNILSLGNGFYYIKGKKPNKTDDVDVDIVNSKKGVEVFSDEDMLGGKSPADLVLEGANPNQVFAAQEQYKQIHGINDDGSKKKARWGIFERLFGKKKDNTQTPVKREDVINFDNLKLTSGRSYTPQYLTDIYNGLIKTGFNKNQAIVLTGTIAEESGGDVFSKSDDKKYTGLLQWEDTRYKVQYPGDREKETNAQLDYIADTIINAKKRKDEGHYDDWTDGGEGSGYNSWTEAYKDFSDSTNVYNMTRGLNTGYVRPTGGIKGNTGSIINRMNAARQIFENNGITDLTYEPVKKRFGGMSKKPKDAFMDSLIESINGLNKIKLNNVNKDNMSPIDLQILDRELNKDILLRNSHSTGVQRKKCGGRIKAVRGTDGKDYTSVDKMPFGVFPAEANYNESNNKQDEADIARGKRAVNAAHWLTYGLGAGTDMLSAIIGSSVEHSTTNKAINKIKELIGKMKSYNLALPNYNTHVEVEPQLAENRRTAAYLKRNADADIIDSKKALAFKRKIENDKLYKDMLIQQYKVNEENKLRNFKTKEQYNIINENIRNATNIENEKLAMMMGMVDKQSENDANLTRNIVGGINSGVRTLLTGLNQNEQMMIAGIDSPEGDNATYGTIGKRIREREEEKERKRKEREDKRKAKNIKFDLFKQNDLLIG